MKLFDDDIVRGTINKSLLSWTGGITFKVFVNSLRKFTEYRTRLDVIKETLETIMIEHRNKNLYAGVLIYTIKFTCNRLLTDMKKFYNEIEHHLEALGEDVTPKYSGGQYYKTKKRRNKNTKKRRNKNTKKRRNKSMRSYYR